MNKGLLEKFSGAAAAYSVRLLNRNYTGPLLKIRRVDSVSSQDNGEIFVFPDNDGWISLDSNVIDPSHTSLATTLGEFLNLKGQPDKDIILSTDPQDAYVVVWKDQSGNANDASQTSTTAQPKLATAGVLVTENGKPALIEQSRNQILTATYTGAASSTIVSVAFIPSVFTKGLLLASGANQFLTAESGSTGGPFNGVGTPTVYVDGALATFTTRDDTYNAFNLNQSLIFALADLSSFTDLDFGQNTNTGSYAYQELIIYNSDQSSNRTKIEEDINDAFNIYSVALSPTERSFLGKYPDAAAAYSVRNLTGKSKQPIVKVRRELGVDTDTEETIYADSTGFLDQSQLLNFVNEVNEDPRLPLDISEGYGYSLRVVKAGYTGPLIQVRESGGNTTKDIYADASGNINVETLKTFCGSNDGHVVKWYNQGGVDRTLEADAAANQPKIVEAGVVVRDTLNNVALKFTNAGNEFLGIKDSTAFDLQEQCIAMHFMPTALPASGSKRIIGVVQPTGEGFDSTIRNTVEITFLGNISLVTGGSNVTLASLAQTVNSPSILTVNFKGGDSSGTSNKTTQAATLVANDIKGLSVGARFTTTSTPDMLVAEVIQYTSAQFDDNKNEIEASLNKHYQIYGDAYVSTWYDQSTAADDTYLLDSNPGAAAAYSLRKLRENYTGKAINIRRDSDQNHLDIGFTSSGELDVDAIINFCGGANGYVTTWYNQAFNSTNELLLDTTEGQGAEAAYSVRQLSSTATECMIIRRASDSKLRTIGFKNRDIDEAAIESFCKGTTCTVQTWKDQSGNGNDATASTGQEPLIYSAGAILKENGKPIVKATNDRTYFDLPISSTDISALFGTISLDTTDTSFISISDGSGSYVAAATSGSSSTTINNNAGGSIQMYQNGASYTITTTGDLYDDLQGRNLLTAINLAPSTWSVVRWGYRNTPVKMMNTQEFILFNIDKSSVRTSIESNINGYYGIYSTNNATQDAQANQPQIYSSSTGLVTESGKPAVQFNTTTNNLTATTNLTHTTATAFVTSKTDDVTQGFYLGRMFQAVGSGTNEIRLTVDRNDRSIHKWQKVISGTATTLSFDNNLNLSQNLKTGVIETSQLQMYLNGVSEGTQSITNSSITTTRIDIGSINGTADVYFKGNIQEIVFYTSDQSNNRLEIEGNINSHYRIYGSNDASQSTSANQPKLVSAGRVILENGRPTVEFDGATTKLVAAFSAINQPNTIFSTATTYDKTTLQLLYDDDNGNNRNSLSVESTGVVAAFAGTALNGSTWSINTQTLHSVLYNSTSSLIHRNGTQISTGDVGTQGLSGFTIGARYSGNYWDGNAQEIVIYNSDQSSNRTGIESSINSQFGMYWDGSKRGLLDSQPNAAAAYSVRALNSSYTGPVVEIRRDSDGTSRDIYATYNGDLDENAIETFCTGTTCTVSTWYDQSGSSNDATQGTALNQPTIYTSGQLVKDGGRLALDFDGSDDALSFSNFSIASATNKAIFIVGVNDETSNNRRRPFSIKTAGGTLTSVWHDGNNTSSFSGNEFINSVTITASTASQYLLTGQDYAGNQSIFQDGFAGGTNTSGGTNTGATAGYIGAYDATLAWPNNQCYFGQLQEIITYTSDKSTDRTNIEENINSYYNIYSKLPGDRLLNKFPGAAAAYSLRVLDSLYTGPLVRVRRDSDGVHADVYPDFNREISIYSKVGVLASSTAPIAAKGTTSLKSFMNGADGFVTVWYDQAESNNASQSSATNQPQIYDGATTSVVTQNGKVALQFDGSNDHLLPSQGSGYNVGTLFGVHDNNASSSRVGAQDYLENSFWFDTTTQMYFRNRGGTITINNTDQFKNWYFLINGTDTSEAAINGATATTGTFGNLGVSDRIGIGRQQASYFNGYFYELILYKSNQSSNRNKIETDINNHYSIYAKQKKLLDAYGGAAAAYSLRRLNSLYTGPLVTIRRDSDNVEVNVYPDFEGNFSLNSIVTNVDETTSGSSQVGFSYTTPYATLSQFVKGNPNCFVVAWKDQSGNGNHATQNVAAYQAKIFDATANEVISNNGKPAIQPTNDPGYPTGVSGLTDATIIAVGNNALAPNSQATILPRIVSSYAGSGSLGVNQMTFTYRSDTDVYRVATSNGEVTVSGNGQPDNFIATFKKDGSNGYIGFNGSAYGTASIASITNELYLFEDAGGSTSELITAHHEIIIYSSAQSDANRTGIETNINTFYSIY